MDARVISFSGGLVKKILEDDPQLERDNNKILKTTLNNIKHEQTFWVKVG